MSYRSTKVKRNGPDGRWMVFLIQEDVVDGQIIETVIGDVKSYATEKRAQNVANKIENDLQYDRDVKQEIAITLQNQKVGQ
tara:strand:+ start:943 stop:1185 length:243 start_codon:yes stop_codon:yes gene_type:complete